MDKSQAFTNDKDPILLGISAVALILFLYLLFFYNPALDGSSNPAVGTLLTQGTVKRRHARSLSWEDLQGAEPVLLRDTVYVPPGVSAVVTFANGKTLKLQSDSMIHFDEILDDTVGVTLFEKWLQKTEPKIVLRPFKYQMAKLDNLGDLEYFEITQLNLNQRASKWDTYKGPREKSQPLVEEPPLVLDQLAYYELKLLEPEQGAIYNIRASRWLDVKWTSIPLDKVNYTLQVSKTEDFKDVLTYTTKQNELEIQFEELSQYFWRVEVSRGKEKVRSNASHFTMANRGRGTSKVLDRLPSSSLMGFEVIVATDANIQNVLSRKKSQFPRCEREGLKPGRYFCQVLGVGTGKIINTYRLMVK